MAAMKRFQWVISHFSKSEDGVIGKSFQNLRNGSLQQTRKIRSSSFLEQELPLDTYRGDMTVRGIELLRDPRTNKGMAFTLKERQLMGIHGMLPPRVFSPMEQARRIMDNVHHWDSDLDKYIYLTALQDRNEKLFFKVLTENISELAPIVYTPTVGLACQNFGFIFRKPRGLFITINDIGHVDDILCNWPETKVKAVVITDGERILGLGDLGANGMGIPVGKLSLYTAMGGVPPAQCLPIVVDVGTDNETLLTDHNYIGLQHKRVRGRQYDELIDEILRSVHQRFGQGTLIQFEDFANHNAFRLLEKYKNEYLTFNDDIQGTASVVVAGLIAAMRVTEKKISENKFLFLGAGEAAIGIAKLLVMAMQEREGLTEAEAAERIWMVDIGGLLTHNRPTGGITKEQELFAKDFKHMTNLEEICREVQPAAAIGASAAAGAFTPQFLSDMASFNKNPIIFALSNPTPKAECTAEQAYTHTQGNCIFASGSPFDPVTYNGKTFYPGQGNNAYIFPGVALGAIVSGAHFITDRMFLTASEALAEMVTEAHLQEGRVYPPLEQVRDVSVRLATRIVEYAYNKGRAATYPEPEDKEAFVRSHMYPVDYETFVPKTWSWPGHLVD